MIRHMLVAIALLFSTSLWADAQKPSQSAEAVPEASRQEPKWEQQALKELDLKMEELTKRLDAVGIQLKDQLEKRMEQYKETMDRLKVEMEKAKDKSPQAEQPFPMMPGMGMEGMMGPGMGMGMPGMEGGMMGMGMPGAFGPTLEERSGWVVRFYPVEKGADMFVPLLVNLLPRGSNVQSNPESTLVAIYTSPEGQEKAEQFMAELGEKLGGAMSASRGARLPQGGGSLSPLAARSVMLEILLLQALNEEPVRKGEEISPEAREMGLEPADLKFLGVRSWKTFGKGFARVDQGRDFMCMIGDCMVAGTVDQAGADRLNVRLRLEFSGNARIETMAETQVGQPTLMLSSNLKNTQGLVVVVVKGKMDPVQAAQGLDAVIPSLNFSDLDLKSFLHTLSNTSGLSFSIAPEVKGKVNLSLKNVTIRQALEFALQSNNCAYTLTPDGKIIRVMTADQYAAETKKK